MIVMVGWAFWPITDSALHGDDVPNSMRTAALEHLSESPLDYVWNAVRHWVEVEGRFFPVSGLENVLLFNTVHSVPAYKFIQWFVVVLLIATVAWMFSVLTRTGWAWPSVGLSFVAAIQTRNWYDPTFGFGLLLQSVTLKFVLSCLALSVSLTSRHRYVWLGVSVFLWALALLQYEVIITLVPSLVIVAVLAGRTISIRRIAWATPHLFVSTSFLVVSQILRRGKNPSPAYLINSDLADSLPAYARQLSGSIPFSAHLWGISSRSLSEVLFTLTLLVIGALAVIVLRSVRGKALVDESPKRLLLVGLIGLNMVLGPGLPTALSVRWQQELSWGLSYLPVFIQYVGVAVLVSSVLLYGLTSTYRNGALRSFGVLVLTVCILSGTANYHLLRANVALQQPAKHQRALYEEAVRGGAFSHVSNNSVILSASSDPNGWVNTYFTSWLGGPSGVTFLRTSTELREYCREGACSATSVHQVEFLQTKDGEQFLVLVPVDFVVQFGNGGDAIVWQNSIRAVATESFKELRCPYHRKFGSGDKRLFLCATNSTLIDSLKARVNE